MSRKASANAMDDVDRLFQCFKCGISPPPSAMRERKRSKSKSNQENISPVGHKSSAASPSTSLPRGRGNVIDGHFNIANSNSRTVKPSGGRQISPAIFYGSPAGVPPKRPISLLRLLREIHIDLSEESKSSISKGAWATFPRQDEAMKFARGHENVRVFSYQDHFSGQRRFLVSTYKEFWNRYKTMDPRHRHHYEVIQEGLPCHLYFDLEFNQKENSGRNGDEMVEILVSIILEALREKYSIEGHEDWVVELDSSTKDKFSRHLIVRIPKTAFKDNSHVGAFVGEISSRIVNAKDKDGGLNKLFICKESNDSSTQLFVDTAVYSRNRCFRLALSSKAGKTSVLKPTGRFKCKDMGEEDVLMTSLICNMDPDCEKLLVCKMELDCARTLRFDTEAAFITAFSNNRVNNNSLGRHQSVTQNFQLNSCFNDMSAPYSMGKSPFPDLDKFIESIASIGNVSGKIRCWYWFSEHGLMVYSMSRSRYCERIDREHKSNHVLYIVDLRRGVYYQKCYDPDCRDYRSPFRPVPDGCIPEDEVYHQGPMNTHIQDQFDDEYNEGEFCIDAEGDVDSASKDSWWLEAVKLADDLENKPKALDLISMDTRKEEDDWWLAAESSISQAEQTQKLTQSMASSPSNPNPNNPADSRVIKASPVYIQAESLPLILTHTSLIQHLHASLPKFSSAITSPLRHKHDISRLNALLLMPSWSSSPSLPYMGVKITTYFPQNSAINLPGIHATYNLFSSTTGHTLASVDATVLTLYRTSCVSGLASKILARDDSQVLIMIGAGALAPHLIKSHVAAKPSLKRVIIWNRTPQKAWDLVETLCGDNHHEGISFESSDSLAEIIPMGDIISCATNSSVPLVKGENLKPGAHLDLVGSFNCKMRECDDEAIRRGRVFVDNEAALEEAGELMGAFERGVIEKRDIGGNLVELISGEKSGRRSSKEITVFKSVGSGTVDLLTAQLVYETYVKY